MRRKACWMSVKGRVGRRNWRGAMQGLVAASALLAAGFCHAQEIERIDVAMGGGNPDAPSLQARANEDGTAIVFLSAASNIVPGDRNGKADVFVADMVFGTVERVSLSFLGRDPNDNSFPAVLDASGNIVVFGSAANNLVTGDFNTVPDIFVYDRSSRQTRILSLARGGYGGGAVPDLPPAISRDGRYVVFASQADDLVDHDDNEASDIFVYDRSTDRIEVLTLTSIGSPETRTANGPSAGPVIADDGCAVAFFSDARNLVRGDTNQARDVFVRDRCAGAIERVSVSSSGEQANGPSQSDLAVLSISGNGRFVVFASKATNLDEIPTGRISNLFLRDRAAGTTRLISKNSWGEAANAPALAPGLSTNGRFVVFQSAADNLVDNDTNDHDDIFVVDLADGEIRLVSITSDGSPSDGDSFGATISGNGERIVFQSFGRLTPDDTNSQVDTYSARNPMATKPLPTSTPEPTIEEPTETPTETPTPAPTNTPTPTRPIATLTATASSTPPSPTQTEALPTATSTSGIATATATNVVPTATGTSGTPTPAVRTATPTSSGHGGGGGCGCRIDSETGRVPLDNPLPALLLPVAMWLVRRRQRRAEQA